VEYKYGISYLCFRLVFIQPFIGNIRICPGSLVVAGGHRNPSGCLAFVGMPNYGFIAKIVFDVASAEVINFYAFDIIIFDKLLEAAQILPPIQIGIHNILITVIGSACDCIEISDIVRVNSYETYCVHAQQY